jgi:lysophospholipase L1-like esterase
VRVNVDLPAPQPSVGTEAAVASPLVGSSRSTQPALPVKHGQAAPPKRAIDAEAFRTRPEIPIASRGIDRLAPPGATAVFLGDSYTSGANGVGTAKDGWPSIVSRALEWRSVNLGVAGTGYVNPGWTAQPVGSRVSEAIAAHPDIVFVAAGHNDTHWSVDRVAGAAAKIVARLRRALPDAVLVIVGPIWQTRSAPSRSLALRDRLRTLATAADAVFVDPVAEGWFAGAARRYIGRDRIHPTTAGHAHIAHLVLGDLAAVR